MYRVIYSKEAKRMLSKIPRKTALLIQAKIEAIATQPYAPHPNASKLQGRDGYRLRVGDWRVIYEVVNQQLIIHVVRIAARGSVYER